MKRKKEKESSLLTCLPVAMSEEGGILVWWIWTERDESGAS
jgi:hypothetical protein